jgi:hypothetical protein
MEFAANSVISGAHRIWTYYCFHVEYLFDPFCETGTVGEILSFHTKERHHSMLTYIFDLYSDDLDANPDAVSLDRAHLDRSGYYALVSRHYQPQPP